jgi:predicted helicase
MFRNLTCLLFFFKNGFIIIPVVILSNVEADKALDDNNRFKD